METNSVPFAEGDSSSMRRFSLSDPLPGIEAGCGFGLPDSEKNSDQRIIRRIGWLDRFHALLVFFAMAIGIILGNFVPNIGLVLRKDDLFGVSIPISESPPFLV